MLFEIFLGQKGIKDVMTKAQASFREISSKQAFTTQRQAQTQTEGHQLQALQIALQPHAA